MRFSFFSTVDPLILRKAYAHCCVDIVAQLLRSYCQYLQLLGEGDKCGVMSFRVKLSPLTVYYIVYNYVIRNQSSTVDSITMIGYGYESLFSEIASSYRYIGIRLYDE